MWSRQRQDVGHEPDGQQRSNRGRVGEEEGGVVREVGGDIGPSDVSARTAFKKEQKRKQKTEISNTTATENNLGVNSGREVTRQKHTRQVGNHGEITRCLTFRI